MIIVSQDKTEILNTERITEIVASDNNICVSDSISQSKGFIIAEYESEERAKEVLNEIIEQYQKICEDTYFVVYEMPEE